MISIIIVSNNQVLFSSVELSISRTVGVRYEIIHIDNVESKFSIFEAYNFGANRSKFDILLFLHEDVIFHSMKWGGILLNYFSTLSNPGILGLAGSSYLPICPSDWWVSDSNFLHYNFYSNSRNGKVGKGTIETKGSQSPQKVFALDGMFLAMKKSVWKEFPFDETLSGFHGYDTDICYQISQKFQNYFVPNILLEHLSEGNPNSIWLKNTIIANSKIIPFILGKKREDVIITSIENKTFHLFLGQLSKFSDDNIYNIVQAFRYFKLINKFTFSFKLSLVFLKYIFYFIFKSISSVFP